MNKIKLLSSFVLKLSVLALIAGSGCIPQKEIIYLQDQTSEKDYANPYDKSDVVTEKYQLRPNDILFIHVNTSNTKLSEFFNPNRSGSGNTANLSSLYNYPINDDYEIDFPFVGKIKLKNCTRSQAADTIKEALKPFLTDAQVTIRLSEPTFVALGEISNPGNIAMDKEQITIYEAIAAAGDLGTYGKRKQVKVVRPHGDSFETFYVDLTDNNLLGSDKYYIYPNDVIYVRPMKSKILGIGESLSFSILTSALALYLSIISL
jgi:polysaccharide export outer membrane protein